MRASDRRHTDTDRARDCPATNFVTADDGTRTGAKEFDLDIAVRV